MRGYTVLELTLALSLSGIVALAAAVGWRRWREAAPLERAAAVAGGELARARGAAMARRSVLRLRVDEGGVLVLSDVGGREIRATRLQAAPFRLDSVRLRPATLRFNARGQGSPGSLYLYRGDRAVRIVINFIGRVRVERLRL